MSIVQGLTYSFKRELLQALHDFTASTGHVFKMALYSSNADLSPDTETYTVTDEASGTGYTAGGITLTSVTPVIVNGVACVDFDDAAWSSSTITARGALIYNSTNGNRSVAVLNFGSDRSSDASTFTVSMPEPDNFNAIIKIK